MKQTNLISTAILAALLGGCGISYIKGTFIKDSQINRELLAQVERYRKAMERRDVTTLMAMASPNYYEDAGTTTPKDDYGYDALLAKFKKRFKRVVNLFMNIKIRRVEVKGLRANVDYYFEGRFLISGKKKKKRKDHWFRESKNNRLEMEKRDGVWKFMSGM